LGFLADFETVLIPYASILWRSFVEESMHYVKSKKP
jgi:hypothetical protein